MLNYIYNFVVFIAECPYFAVISGMCSMLSLIAVFTLIKQHNERPKNKINQKEAHLLIESLQNKTHIKNIFSLSEAQEIPVPGINPSTVLKQQSFQIYFFNSGDGCSLYLLQIRKRLYLYATLSIKIPNYRLIATSKSNPELLQLHQKFLNINSIANEENFISELLKKINKF